MEPLMSLEGYLVLENPKQARALLNKYFEQQGYTVVSGKENHSDNQQVPQIQVKDSNR